MWCHIFSAVSFGFLTVVRSRCESPSGACPNLNTKWVEHAKITSENFALEKTQKASMKYLPIPLESSVQIEKRSFKMHDTGSHLRFGKQA